MGIVKNLMIEQGDYGFSALEHFDTEVCASCIDDEGLRDFVARQGPIDTCEFCGNTAGHGMTVYSLFKYMSSRIHEEWDDPIQEVGWDRGFDPCIDIIDNDDLLIELDEPLANDALREVFVSAFDHDWCQRHPYGLDHSDRLWYSWDQFSHLVKHRHRYLFLSQTTADDSDLIGPGEILNEIAVAMHNSDRVFGRLAQGTQLWRARAHDHGQRFTTARELGSPPIDYASENRMSPAGISMFYAAESADTARREARSANTNEITVAAWTTHRDLAYLDLTNTRPIPSLFDMTGARQRVWLRFLDRFAADLSKPARDQPGIEYVPTQVVTEYVRDAVRTADGPIEAIKYRSAVVDGQDCWVLFGGPEACADPGSASGATLVVVDPQSSATTTR